MPPLTTPDGRYLIVRGRLWRTTNPGLSEPEREHLVHELMDARRAVKSAKANGDEEALAAARRAVDSAKRGLGEHGPVWWTDGERDWNRCLMKNSPYAGWFGNLAEGGVQQGRLYISTVAQGSNAWLKHFDVRPLRR
ncbi:hypothetical protein [Stenotrophomonas maltophilia]|jgi:hypothetical protein|uniref:hypothetical protein n=1 Tax=Stenotrophomonas maltophilia TaxID=40324 RepID=UPI000B21235A|nr:hypothetical protein [Stenotrophomonas maltophilia]